MVPSRPQRRNGFVSSKNRELTEFYLGNNFTWQNSKKNRVRIRDGEGY